jgi:hypothetical protein
MRAWLSRLALVLCVAGPSPARAQRTLDLPYLAQGPSPWCAAAAVLMVARFFGAQLELVPLVRSVQVAADGIAWLDLADALAPHGFEVLATTAGPDEVRRALDQGQPLVASMKSRGAKHALVVRGWDAQGFVVLDPRDPEQKRIEARDFVARWAGRQIVVVRPRARPAEGLPLERWRAENRRYRAIEWGRRAQRADAPEHALALARKGLAEDPSLAELQVLVAEQCARLGRQAEALDALRRALALAWQSGSPLQALVWAHNLRLPEE